jgi:1,4-alpha-glucan branching enzyme
MAAQAIVSIDQGAATAIVSGTHGDPFAVLGPHRTDRGTVVRTFQPEARRVCAVGSDGTPLAELSEAHPAGLFSGVLPGDQPYRLRVTWPDGNESEGADPYAFGLLLGDMDLYLLREGTHRDLPGVLGAHAMTIDGVSGTRFAVWAPNAARVSVVGDFNLWDGRRHPMRHRVNGGIWELFVPDIAPGTRYKYELLSPQGALLPLKADPCGGEAELPPATASIVPDLHRTEPVPPGPSMDVDAPVSFYEVHAGSWARRPDGTKPSWDELAEQLIAYVVEMGFTHIEFMPITEHPFEGSWGYQPIGLFAPTSRHGRPEAFARFVERAHAAGIGVVLDWVPGHFPNDMHGLVRFDGTALYEHQDPREGFHPDWNTLIYNFGRHEVRAFLIASALHWLQRYGCDALRVDAVASMLYRDYSRAAGQWLPNVHGGRENLEAIGFLREMNREVRRYAPDRTTIAEESTAWPGVSTPESEGGLGFSYKWNMGWMHDTLQYMTRDSVHRRHHHNEMTFSMVYAFSERFVLPLSHDEVVHGKGSLLGKMPGDRWQQFANLRAYFGFMYAHPGKKLLFMGGEFAQLREWNHDRALDWDLLDDPMHRGVQRLVRELNRLYRQAPALHRRDCSPDGFRWVIGDDAGNSVFAFLRLGTGGDPPALAISNFTPVPRHGYRIGVPRAGRWVERLNTDATSFGGSGLGNLGGVVAEAVPVHGHANSLSLTLPPLATLIFLHEHI